MDEVSGLLERDLTAVLKPLVDCVVLPGAANGSESRPDEYISVVAGDAEIRGGGVYLVEMDVRVVVPVDDPAVAERARVRVRAVADYLDAADCPFRSHESDDLRVHGYRVTGLHRETGTRSRAEIISLVVGAGALL